VGDVPIVRLTRCATVFERCFAYLKLESCNPGGSIKEKNAVWLVQEAERSGALKPGGTIVESSSGNFGLALAMMGALKGYRVMIVVDNRATRGHAACCVPTGPNWLRSHPKWWTTTAPVTRPGSRWPLNFHRPFREPGILASTTIP
jgi:cysteine synthase